MANAGRGSGRVGARAERVGRAGVGLLRQRHRVRLVLEGRLQHPPSPRQRRRLVTPRWCRPFVLLGALARAAGWHAAAGCCVPAAACRLLRALALHGLTGSWQELLGGGKEKESLRSLLRARRFLNLKFGNIVVVFGQPIDVQVSATVLQPCRALAFLRAPKS